MRPAPHYDGAIRHHSNHLELTLVNSAFIHALWWITTHLSMWDKRGTIRHLEIVHLWCWIAAVKIRLCEIKSMKDLFDLGQSETAINQMMLNCLKRWSRMSWEGLRISSSMMLIIMWHQKNIILVATQSILPKSANANEKKLSPVMTWFARFSEIKQN